MCFFVIPKGPSCGSSDKVTKNSDDAVTQANRGRVIVKANTVS